MTARRASPSPTSPVPLAKVVADLERQLRHAEIADWSQAMNGLHLENSGEVTRVGAAVDGCEATIAMAVEQGIDLLLVHHGLFWSGPQRIAGPAYRKLRRAMEGNLAIFSSHLPLDLHPKLGNNALLAKAIGWKQPEPFFPEKGSLLGLRAKVSLDREALRERVARAVGGPVQLIPGGPQRCRSVGLVTGGAGGEVFKAAAEGIDTFITGEAPHWAYTAAEELGINVLLAGHYATETFGVKALAEYVSAKYRLPWEFLDHPTGL